MDPAAVGPSITAMSTGLGTFTTMLPNMSDVRRSSPDSVSMCAELRHSEMVAGAITLGAGVILSAITKSPTPAYVAFAVIVGLVVMYEHALRTPPAEMTTTTEAK